MKRRNSEHCATPRPRLTKRERKRNQAEKEKETASQVREKLALEMGCDVPPEMDEKTSEEVQKSV